MKKLVRKAAWPLYILAMAAFSAAAISSYLNASTILGNHTVVDAPVELVDSSSRTKKGHTTVTYRFEYRYSVAGEEFAQPYSAVNEKGEEIVASETLQIAYDNGDPSRAGTLDMLQRQADLAAMIRRILIAGAIFGALTFFIYVWAGYQRRVHCS